MRLILLLLLAAATSSAQWQLHDAHTTADLRGIDNVGHGVAWASGTDGTILRTLDNGEHWQLCAKPPGGEHLDFRAIEAFDNNTAIAMSSGKGDLSRLYKTTDGCQSWHLLFTNPDPDGFWDAMAMQVKPPFSVWPWMRRRYPMLMVLGDPIGGKKKFRVWRIMQDRKPKAWDQPPAKRGETAFAASNSVLLVYHLGYFQIATGGTSGAGLITAAGAGEEGETYYRRNVPVGDSTDSSGIFSVAFDRSPFDRPGKQRHGIARLRSGLAPRNESGNWRHVVAVGGDYKAPNDRSASAAYSLNSEDWATSATQPGGYRSAVAYDAATKNWITVGPNGTDISTDDGRNWRALQPSPGEAADTAQHWNALSLPYAVGPHGRIGTLRPAALQPTK